jgi:NhaA family Na+:H+ antiporter
VLLLVLVAANRAGVRSPAVYGGIGVLVWLLFLGSGVHATVAGVLVALTVPARVRLDPGSFLAAARRHGDAFASAAPAPLPGFASGGQIEAIHALERECERAGTPLQRLEHALHPWVSFGIMPIFALANAGVRVVGESGAFAHPAAIAGIALGLVVGKPLGIAAMSWLAVRAGIAELPDGVRWSQLLGVACLGGIGFTMALFIAALAFSQATMLAAAKVGVLAASLAAAAVGVAMLAVADRVRKRHGDAPVRG